MELSKCWNQQIEYANLNITNKLQKIKLKFAASVACTESMILGTIATYVTHMNNKDYTYFYEWLRMLVKLGELSC